jgi:hypothetical protein
MIGSMQNQGYTFVSMKAAPPEDGKKMAILEFKQKDNRKALNG